MIAGKATRMPSRTTSATMKGMTPRNTVWVGTSGSTLRSTKTLSPTGGVIMLISVTTTTMMPNQIRS